METHFDNQILEKDFGNSIEFVKWLFEKLLFIILYLFCNINQHSASRSLSCSQLIFSTKYYHNLLFIWKIAHKNIALGFFLQNMMFSFFISSAKFTFSLASVLYELLFVSIVSHCCKYLFLYDFLLIHWEVSMLSEFSVVPV